MNLRRRQRSDAIAVSRKRKERACRRCGCTERNACMKDGEPCSWVGGADVCTVCLTPQERMLWVELVGNLTAAQNGYLEARRAVEHCHFQQRLFSKILEDKR